MTALTWSAEDAERIKTLRALSRTERISGAERAELRALIYRETVVARGMLTARARRGRA